MIMIQKTIKVNSNKKHKNYSDNFREKDHKAGKRIGPDRTFSYPFLAQNDHFKYQI